jgi:hypothetical protein
MRAHTITTKASTIGPGGILALSLPGPLAPGVSPCVRVAPPLRSKAAPPNVGAAKRGVHMDARTGRV